MQVGGLRSSSAHPLHTSWSNVAADFLFGALCERGGIHAHQLEICRSDQIFGERILTIAVLDCHTHHAPILE